MRRVAVYERAADDGMAAPVVAGAAGQVDQRRAARESRIAGA
jgi:hypothetical protein